MKHLLLLVIAVSTFASGCGKDNFPRYTTLSGFRVLGLKATPPETTPGSTVAMQALLSDIGGGGRTVSYTVQLCSDPGIGFGSDPTCSGRSDTITSTGTINTLTANTYTAAVTLPNITVPSNIFSSRNIVDQYNGVAYLVVYTFVAGTTQIVAFKRIIASSKSIQNTNPSIIDMTVNNASLTALPNGTVTVYPSIVSGSQENFPVLNGNGTTSYFQENLTVTWFASDGSFSHQRSQNTDGNSYSAPGSSPTDHATVLVGVVRDGRGGESWLIRSF